MPSMAWQASISRLGLLILNSALVHLLAEGAGLAAEVLEEREDLFP